MPKDDDNELPMAEDAIPINALRLTEAYEIVVDAIELVPKRGTISTKIGSRLSAKAENWKKTLGTNPKNSTPSLKSFGIFER